MAWIDEVEAEDGRVLAELYTTHDCYLLPDGTHAYIDCCAAWCPHCKTFVLAEKLTSGESLAANARAFREHRRANSVDPERYDRILAVMLHEAEQWGVAMASRKSPPRCLKCGLGDFVALPYSTWVADPSHTAQGRIRVKCHSQARMSPGRLYDTEGLPIPGRFASKLQSLRIPGTMSVTIYHNPRCTKSRETLKLLHDRGVEPKIVEYLGAPPSAAELKHILKLLGKSPREILRAKEAKDAGVDSAKLSDDELIAAMVNHPAVIERPIVVKGNKAAVGRPPEAVLGIL